MGAGVMTATFFAPTADALASREWAERQARAWLAVISWRVRAVPGGLEATMIFGEAQ